MYFLISNSLAVGGGLFNGMPEKFSVVALYSFGVYHLHNKHIKVKLGGKEKNLITLVLCVLCTMCALVAEVSVPLLL